MKMRLLSAATPEIRFRVTGGPFAAEQIMGWHITDEKGHTVAVSPDHTFAAELNDLYALVYWLKKADGLYVFNECRDDGDLDNLTEQEWQEHLRPLLNRLLQGDQSRDA